MKKKVYSSTIIYEIKRRTKDNPIFSKELERLFGISDVKVRDAVHKARTKDELPIGAENKGYFLARNKSEILRTVASLRSRAMRCLEAADGIKKGYKDDNQQELL